MAKKILIVDDEADFAQLLMFDMKKRGYEVALAGDGEEGMQKIGQFKPDLIVFDIKMPKMDGYTFVKNVKKDPETKNLPMIALTSFEPMRDIFEMEGVGDYFVKSAKMEQLFATIGKYLNPPEASGA
ncbi:MAG TPA: response regulator [Candidatus Omnitrophota bacterium]|nr:response regulator [Candidatus Omnitrophota bacterium]